MLLPFILISATLDKFHESPHTLVNVLSDNCYSHGDQYYQSGPSEHRM